MEFVPIRPERTEDNKITVQERFVDHSMHELDKRVFGHVQKSIDWMRKMFDFTVRSHDELVEATRNNEAILRMLELQIRSVHSEPALIQLLAKKKYLFNFTFSQTAFGKQERVGFGNVAKDNAKHRYSVWTNIRQENVTFPHFVYKTAKQRMVGFYATDPGKEKSMEDNHPTAVEAWLKEESKQWEKPGASEEEQLENMKLAALKAISETRTSVMEAYAGRFTGGQHNVERPLSIIRQAVYRLASLGVTMDHANQVAEEHAHAQGGHTGGHANPFNIPRVNSFLDAYQIALADKLHLSAGERFALVRPYRFFESGGPDQLSELLWEARDAYEGIHIHEAQMMREKDIKHFESDTLVKAGLGEFVPALKEIRSSASDIAGAMKTVASVVTSGGRS